MIIEQSQQNISENSSPADKIWQEVFAWLRQLPQDNPNGEQEIRGREIYANFVTAETQKREILLMEVHKEYVDVHYCIAGGEIIEWAPIESLEVSEAYEAKKDCALFLPPVATVNYRTMVVGEFAIFFPGEPHMPKINDGINKVVQKVIVKIKASLLR